MTRARERLRQPSASVGAHRSTVKILYEKLREGSSPVFLRIDHVGLVVEGTAAAGTSLEPLAMTRFGGEVAPDHPAQQTPS